MFVKILFNLTVVDDGIVLVLNIDKGAVVYPTSLG